MQHRTFVKVVIPRLAICGAGAMAMRGGVLAHRVDLQSMRPLARTPFETSNVGILLCLGIKFLGDLAAIFFIFGLVVLGVALAIPNGSRRRMSMKTDSNG